MNTIRCYDRFTNAKRLAALIGIATGIAAGLLLALPSRAEQPQRLPTVVINGKSSQTLAAMRDAGELRTLPTVVVSGRRADRAFDGEQVAAR
ncbi:hypothetical protein [Mitsuaria sp. GD03876]|uniref:hypothetical protein n=1 Tax=Mitsuaria sp. GD03876 TaxID=2975399 RepID=UPI002446A107|nr:hypothetical protein [Mitsuaria sp. GD03876]MDH0868102.1 hypothetical protein [Mitsuaria sp. GD03876]